MAVFLAGGATVTNDQQYAQASLRYPFILNSGFILVPPGWPESESVFGNQVVRYLCNLLFQRRKETTALNKGLTMQAAEVSFGG